MLRHYDEIGLLTPARVDPSSGYRSYDGRQFAVLARIVAVKELGFRLDEVAQIVHGEVTGLALQELLSQRRADLVRQLDLDTTRLRRLDAHLRHIKGESVMPTITTEVKPLPPQRVAQASAVAPGFGPELIGPVIGPLFAELQRQLVAQGTPPRSAAVACYEALEAGDGAGARVHAAFVVGEDITTGTGFVVTELPGADLAVTTVHHGTMAGIGQTWGALLEWIEENGYQLAGICREVYLVSEPHPQEEWVTELQQPVVRR